MKLGGYWNYYDKDYKWNYQNPNINLNYTRTKFMSIGMSEEEAEKHINSGYICLEHVDVVVDRFYGGCLMSSDFRTRFPLDKFNLHHSVMKKNIWVEKAKSIVDIKNIVDTYTSKTNRNYLFRGQTSNYQIEREINNPNFIVPEFGEISLLPSLWRVMLNTNPTSFDEFRNLTPMEWSYLLYSKFDLEDIKHREKILADKGELIFTMSDMEDCSDPILREFGKYRLDLMMHMDNILAPTLITLLQHYGLYSNVLDLTKSLDVALFFATHKFNKMDNNISKYNFIGTNKRQSLIYIIREDSREMVHHDDSNETIKPYNPLRPILQECVVSTSSTCALNLPADFIEGIIVLDFDLDDSSLILSESELFPSEKNDTFLNILKKHKVMKKYLTEFETSNKT